MRNWNLKFTEFVTEHFVWVFAIGIFITVILTYPFTQWAPKSQASPNPPGEVYDLQIDIDNKFPTPVHIAGFVLEARQEQPGMGDVLTSNVLLEFKNNLKDLILLDQNKGLTVGTLETQTYLFQYFDYDMGSNVHGISSILNAIEESLFGMGITLETASDDQIKLAVHHLFKDKSTRRLRDFLSVDADFKEKTVMGQEIDYWVSPAMLFYALADNSKLGSSGLEIGMGGGPDVINKEHLNRKIMEVMSGTESAFEIWGIAIDANLEAEDEGKTAGIYIMFTIIAAVIVVGISLKSYWVTAFTGIGLSVLIIWLKGISAIVGLKSGLVIDLVVPISMISLGVDFVVHAVRRYQEEIRYHVSRVQSFRVGYSAVLIALLMAMASDGIAFLSNLSSNIEAVIHFGCAAAVAVFSSFLVLGFLTPLATMKIDELILNSRLNCSGWRWNILRWVSIVAVAVISGISVVLMIALDPFIGILLLLASLAIFVLIPVCMFKFKVPLEFMGWGNSNSANDTNFDATSITTNVVVKLVESVSSRVWVSILIVIFFTSIMTYFAMRLEPSFDVKDFFDSDSEFVEGLDKLDEHVRDSGGEPGIAYVSGDLTDPEAMSAILLFVDQLRGVDEVALSPSGEVTFGLNALTLLNVALSSEEAKLAIYKDKNVSLTDFNHDGIPDTREQIRAVYEYGSLFGIPGSNEQMALSVEQVRGSIYFTGDGLDLTTISFQIPGTRDQSVVTASGNALRPIIARLGSHESIYKTGLTGSPFTREKQLTESTKTLYTSLPIAIIAAMILLIFTMRSFKYALVTVIPIGLVVVWLYGVMYIAGFALNYVTAMIGAISIGVGIDYSIHMTQRYREEMNRSQGQVAAIRNAAAGTGVALVASAASSIIGFTVMGFAPMPIFASYGQLTAVMIFFALIAALLVLPCLLIIVSRGE